MRTEAESPLLTIPTELRMMIYDCLFDHDGKFGIEIRNIANRLPKRDDRAGLRRSTYHVLDRTVLRRSHETTYGIANGRRLHLEIMAVNRRIREEASRHLYGRHAFHFGRDIEAIVPFFHDKTPETRSLVRGISLRKRSPVGMADTDSCEWAAVCRYLTTTLPNLTKLRVVIEVGVPRGDWDGPRQLSVSDLQFLYSTRHESLAWARHLEQVKTLEEVEFEADNRFLAMPSTTSMLIFAAFSASVRTSLPQFLRSHLGIPVRLTNSAEG